MFCTKETFKRVLFSPTLADKNQSHRIAYIAVMTALNVIINFFSIPTGIAQFSIILFISALTGIILGSIFGFVACFIGDTLSFFIGGGSGFSPWVGIAVGMTAFIAGVIINGIPTKKKKYLYLKLLLVSLLSFLITTLAINTTAGYFLWNSKGLPFWDFFVLRFFIMGQIWNSLFNYALLFIAVPALSKVKPLGLRL